MKISFSFKWLAMALIGLQAACVQDKPVVTLCDELEPLYPDSVITETGRTHEVDAARGTIASVHFFFNNLAAGDELDISIKGPKGFDPGTVSWYRFLDVPVNENTGLDSRTEQFTGQTNPYVIRRAPFRIYEAMDPVVPPVAIMSNTEAYRLEIPVTEAMTPGRHDFRISITSGKLQKKLTFAVNVYPAVVPALKNSRLNYVNWHNNQIIARDHDVEIWSEPFWTMLEQYARLMAKGRQNTFWFIWSDFFTFHPDGTVAGFEEERLERYIRTFLDEGLTLIQGAPFCRRRDWNSDAFLVGVPTVDEREIPAVSPEGRIIIRDMATRVVALMNRNGWEQDWVQGIFDEPTDEYVDRYKAVAELLREIIPGIRILEATMTVSLSDVVDCWCPQVQEYQANMDFFENRKKAGDDVWVYTCLIPGGPWINRLLDQERLRQVYVGWACAGYDLQGFLHWGFNHHGEDAFEDLIRNNGGPGNFLPAGDSHIVYPGKNGPLSSQRFEAHRIGMEDHELLIQLIEKNQELADELINRLFQSFDRYSKDIKEYRKVKAELLNSLQ